MPAPHCSPSCIAGTPILPFDRDIEDLAASAGAPLDVRTSRRARRMNLRVDPRSGAIVLTMPVGADLSAAKDFVGAQRTWIARHVASLPERIPFDAGAAVPILGERHVIVHVPGRGIPVARTPGQLYVTGDVRHVSRRITDYLRRLTARELGAAVAGLARRIDHRVPRITIRDPKTRWGSCSSVGTLSFSWRLIMAPRSVLTYVAAHEVAHLRHANHGPRFWALVGELHPGFQQDRQTLKRLAFDLNRYGDRSD